MAGSGINPDGAPTAVRSCLAGLALLIGADLALAYAPGLALAMLAGRKSQDREARIDD